MLHLSVVLKLILEKLTAKKDASEQLFEEEKRMRESLQKDLQTTRRNITKLEEVHVISHMTLVIGHMTLVLGHMTLVLGHMILVIGHMILVIGHMTLVIDHMTLVIGHMILVIGHMTLVLGHMILVIGHMTLVLGHMTLVLGHMTLVLGHMTLVLGHMTLVLGHMTCLQDKEQLLVEIQLLKLKLERGQKQLPVTQGSGGSSQTKPAEDAQSTLSGEGSVTEEELVQKHFAGRIAELSTQVSQL